jgi:hypothetical protein
MPRTPVRFPRIRRVEGGGIRGKARMSWASVGCNPEREMTSYRFSRNDSEIESVGSGGSVILMIM